MALDAVEAKDKVKMLDVDQELDNFEPFVKENSRARGTVHGVHSKSKVYHVPRRGEHRDALDTFSFVGRQRSGNSTIEIGDETFFVNDATHPASRTDSVHYSVNKNRRWEYVSRLGEFVQEDTYDGEADDFDDSAENVSPRSDSDLPTGGATGSGRGHLYVYHTTRGVTSPKQADEAQKRFRQAGAKIARSNYEANDDEVDYTIVKTRKGRKAVPLKQPPTDAALSPLDRELGAATIFVSVEQKRKNGQKALQICAKARGCNCPSCNSHKKTVRAHKYKGAEHRDVVSSL